MPVRRDRPARSDVPGQDVRGRLLQAAAELIPQHGWGAVSTRMIAERAGVSAGLVHYHFGSVQALLSRAALDTIRAVIGGMGAMLDDAATPGQVLNTLFSALDSYSGRDPISLLMVETYLAATRDEPLRNGLSAVVVEFRDELAGVLGERGVPDPAGAAAVLAAAIDGVVLHRALGLPLPASTITRVLGRTLRDGAGEGRSPA
jgi:AcrR family transcriptional regulator